ncbi:MAG TPA: PilZ domain-containing protein [Polyangia bacterium]|nr:PilZ domain-containing protein [Polyangia bacterium]
MSERRFGYRVPLEMFLNEYVHDRLHRCVTTNLSESGLHVHKLITPPQRRPAGVQLEFELPGTGEVIWAKGEVAFEQYDDYFHGTGVRLTGIARLHARLLRDFVREKRNAQLGELLDQIRRNRYH